MSHFVCALRQVIDADLRRLSELEARLQEARGPVVAGVVKSIGETCDSLSAALTRLAKNTDTVAAPDNAPPGEPVHDPRGLEIGARLQAILANGVCPKCEGIIMSDDELADSEMPWRAVNRARRATE